MINIRFTTRQSRRRERGFYCITRTAPVGNLIDAALREAARQGMSIISNETVHVSPDMTVTVLHTQRTCK